MPLIVVVAVTVTIAVATAELLIELGLSEWESSAATELVSSMQTDQPFALKSAGEQQFLDRQKSLAGYLSAVCM